VAGAAAVGVSTDWVTGAVCAPLGMACVPAMPEAWSAAGDRNRPEVARIAERRALHCTASGECIAGRVGAVDVVGRGARAIE